MSELTKRLSVSGFGILTGVNGYFALDKLLEAANIKVAALQTQLANAPELTEQLYRSARETAEKVASGDYYLGLFSATAAGASLGFCIYHACRKNKE